jgi:hypothetical protein
MISGDLLDYRTKSSLNINFREVSQFTKRWILPEYSSDDRRQSWIVLKYPDIVELRYRTLALGLGIYLRDPTLFNIISGWFLLPVSDGSIR